MGGRSVHVVSAMFQSGANFFEQRLFYFFSEALFYRRSFLFFRKASIRERDTLFSKIARHCDLYPIPQVWVLHAFARAGGLRKCGQPFIDCFNARILRLWAA